MLDRSPGLELVDSGFVDRYLNEGFSGGEKKRNEVMQLAIHDPRLVPPAEAVVNRASRGRLHRLVQTRDARKARVRLRPSARLTSGTKPRRRSALAFDPQSFWISA